MPDAKPTKWRLAEGMTWRGKLESAHPSHGKTVPMPQRWRKSLGAGRMLIAKPLDVDALMRKASKGRLLTVSQIRDELARMAKVKATCPMTTGIFMRIVAEAAEEDRRAGKKRITPYWRTIRDDGRLIEKFPGGTEAQATRLREEGLLVTPTPSGRLKVIEFEKHLAKL